MLNSKALVAGLLMLATVSVYLLLHRTPSSEPNGAPIVVVAVPELERMELEGEVAFQANCASCHGTNAAGMEGVAPPLVHRIYEPGHHGDQAFFAAARLGVRAHHWPFADMPPVEGLTDVELASVVAYIRALQRANGID